MTLPKTAKSQNLDSLVNCYKVYHETLLIAELSQFKVKEKYKLLNYLPIVGYDAFRNSPIITFSFNSIANSKRNNDLNKAKVSEIELKYKLLFEEKEREVKLLLTKLKLKVKSIENLSEIFEVEKEIFELKKQLYESHQIQPQEFLAAKLNFLQKKKELTELQNSIIIDKENIKLSCHCK